MSLPRRKRRGFEAERRLARMLARKRGNHVFRVPVSGSRELPDVFMVNDSEDRVVAFEVKTCSGNRVKVPGSQVARLLRFVNAFGKYRRREAVVAVCFRGEGRWVFRLVRSPLPEDVVVRSDEESDWAP